MSNDENIEPDARPLQTDGARSGRALVKRNPEPRKTESANNKSTEKHPRDQTEQYNALFKWAQEVLKDMGLLDALRDAKTRVELDAVKLDEGNLVLIVAIRDALHPGAGKKRKKHFESLTEGQLRAILRNRLNDNKKDEKDKLVAGEERTAAAEEARERREENAKFYGDFKQYKVVDHGGVYVLITEALKSGESVTKWVQLSRTRIDLVAVTRSRQDDNWGIYVKIHNMDGRATRLAIPRNIINDKQGSIAGRLNGMGVDVVREQRKHLPDFLLTTVEVVDDDTVQELVRFRAVPTTGWCQLNNGRFVFVLPGTTKFPADLPAGELAIFQTEQIHLKHGFASEGTVEEWCEQIAGPFAGNCNVILAVGVALSGPLTVWAGIPPGLFHIFCGSKQGKSLVSAIGQSVYGRPLIPNETVLDPFGTSWLATANSIGRLILVRSSIGAFIEELNQGNAGDIADAAYRIANGIDKMRMRGRNLEPRLAYCVPGFSTGEEPMVDFLTRKGQRVTDGMRARFADIPADVQPGSVFETFSGDAVPGLGKKYYPLLGKFYGAVGDAWLQLLVNLGPDKITAEVNDHQQEFRSRSRMAAIYKVAGPYRCSVIDRFATVAAACRMAIKVGLPWKSEDTDAGIEACVIRWADHDKLNPVVVAIVEFTHGQKSWEGTASQLLPAMNGAVDSAESLGRWLRKAENVQRLKAVGLQITHAKSTTRDRTRSIRIERVGAE
jgi:hypothetical protein